ncbi:MAG: hypothetical protein V2A57_02430, partial [Elusimicrobiota bacterium]
PTLIILFLTKGANAPLGGVFIWMLENIPYFYVFKTPLEKFNILYIFMISLALVPVVRGGVKKWTFYLLIAYLAACSIPYVTLNFMPDVAFETDDNGKPTKFISKKYLYKADYFNAIQEINRDKLDYRYISAPGSGNYQETIFNHNERYYRGVNPFLQATNKSFIAAYASPTSDFFYSIFKNFSNSAVLEGSLNIYGAKKIVFNKDIYGSFGFVQPESPKELFDILSEEYEKEEFGPIGIFNREKYLPRLYTARSVISSFDSQEQLSEVFLAPGYQIQSVIYFQNDNSAEENNQIKSLKPEKLPILEYKKINPVKYRVRVHQAQGQFPLVLSEAFYHGWETYSSKSPITPPDPDELGSYKILNGNEEEQADADEVLEYLKQGWVTALGDGEEKKITHQKLEGNKAKTKFVEKYAIDFISKNFQGTIQNDNLAAGPFYETWFKKPIENNNNHLKANGYANSWIIDTSSICIGPSACRQNTDGTYDFELLVEFWPQRLFYVGFFLSGTAFLISLSLLIYARRRKESYKQN